MTDAPRGPTTEELRARVLAHDDATRHVWGPWVSSSELWGGAPHRLCSCGLSQWLDSADPHAPLDKEKGERLGSPRIDSLGRLHVTPDAEQASDLSVSSEAGEKAGVKYRRADHGRRRDSEPVAPGGGTARPTRPTPRPTTARPGRRAPAAQLRPIEAADSGERRERHARPDIAQKANDHPT